MNLFIFFKDFNMSWQKVNDISEIKFGDILRGTNWTYSQKYIGREDFEEFNNTRMGIVITHTHKNFFDIIIENEFGEKKFVIYDCGSSGEWEVEKKI